MPDPSHRSYEDSLRELDSLMLSVGRKTKALSDLLNEFEAWRVENGLPPRYRPRKTSATEEPPEKQDL